MSAIRIVAVMAGLAYVVCVLVVVVYGMGLIHRRREGIADAKLWRRPR